MTVKGHKQFRIVCTDQGQHSSRELIVLYPEPPWVDGVWVGDEADLGRKWADWVPEGDRNSTGRMVTSNPNLVTVGNSTTAWRFPCPSCKRDVPMTDDHLAQVVMGYIEIGAQQLDISRIPS